MESLFSLEVVINFIKLDHTQIKCLMPTVAFRLLDYPSISIPLLDDHDRRELREKFEINKELDSKLKEISHFNDLLDKHGRYIYSKGKSCLFRCELNSLQEQLRHMPLYLMILDSYDDTYKLCGTSVLSLSGQIDEICFELDGDLNKPCTKLTHGIFDIKTLMGCTIGHVSCATRMTSFGGSLLPHIGITSDSQERHIKTIKGDAHVQTIPIDYKNAQIQIDTPKSNKPLTNDIYTQSEKLTKKVSIELREPKTKVTKQETKIEDEFVFNHFCPPILSYNSQQEQVKELTKSENEQKRIDFLKEAIEYEVDHDDEHEYNTELEEEKVDKIQIKKEPSRKQVEKVHTPLMDLNNFPIIQSLFNEIKKLQQQQQQYQQVDVNQVKEIPLVLEKVDQEKKKSKKLIDYAKKRAKEKAFKEELLKEKLNKNLQAPSLIGILKPAKKLNKLQMFESVQRLSQSKQKSTSLLEIEKLNKNKQLNVINQINNNLSNIKLSTNLSSSTSFHNNLSNNSITTNTKSTHHSSESSSLALLNRVEMESTLDNYLNRTINGGTALRDSPRVVKLVQFGNTFIKPSSNIDTESTTSHHITTSNTSTNTTCNTTPTIHSNRQQLQQNEQKSTSFTKSSSSKYSSNNFELDEIDLDENENEDEKSSKLLFADSSTKYSNETSTRSISEENFFLNNSLKSSF